MLKRNWPLIRKHHSAPKDILLCRYISTLNDISYFTALYYIMYYRVLIAPSSDNIFTAVHTPGLVECVLSLYVRCTELYDSCLPGRDIKVHEDSSQVEFEIINFALIYSRCILLLRFAFLPRDSALLMCFLLIYSH